VVDVAEVEAGVVVAAGVAVLEDAVGALVGVDAVGAVVDRLGVGHVEPVDAAEVDPVAVGEVPHGEVADGHVVGAGDVDAVAVLLGLGPVEHGFAGSGAGDRDAVGLVDGYVLVVDAGPDLDPVALAGVLDGVLDEAVLAPVGDVGVLAHDERRGVLGGGHGNDADAEERDAG
jgi:hypothetical protein